MHRTLAPVRNPRGEMIERLTQRQYEVALLISEGLTNDQIAERLCINVFTVKTHVQVILRKTRMEHRSGVMLALQREPLLRP